MGLDELELRIDFAGSEMHARESLEHQDSILEGAHFCAP